MICRSVARLKGIAQIIFGSVTTIIHMLLFFIRKYDESTLARGIILTTTTTLTSNTGHMTTAGLFRILVLPNMHGRWTGSGYFEHDFYDAISCVCFTGLDEAGRASIVFVLLVRIDIVTLHQESGRATITSSFSPHCQFIEHSVGVAGSGPV